jgi:hypothetical protein
MFEIFLCKKILKMNLSILNANILILNSFQFAGYLLIILRKITYLRMTPTLTGETINIPNFFSSIKAKNIC